MSTFLDALKTSQMATSASVIVIDDSDDETEADLLRAMLHDLGVAHPGVALEVAGRGLGPSPKRTIVEPGGGPGAARNRGLARLREGDDDNDLIMMFDDDVCFADVDYRAERLRCDGATLIAQAISACDRQECIIGCGYVGRQDLSILEHAWLDDSEVANLTIAPATDRATVEHVAPGGISTAFLTVRAPARRLPDFPEHYNEDYVWLYALHRAGWPLDQIELKLVHAPPGGVAVTAPALSFQIFGEIVWLAVLEAARFPVDTPLALVAAIEEIVGDMRKTLVADSICATIATVIGEVTEHYERLAADVAAGVRTPTADALRAAITRGISLSPR